MKKNNILKRVVSTLVVVLLVVANINYAFASEDSIDVSNANNQTSEQSNDFFKEFSGVVDIANANVCTFTAPETGSYTITIVTGHISGDTQNYAFALSVNGGFWKYTMINNNRFQQTYYLTAGVEYTIGLYGTSTNSKYAYSGTIRH